MGYNGVLHLVVCSLEIASWRRRLLGEGEAMGPSSARPYHDLSRSRQLQVWGAMRGAGRAFVRRKSRLGDCRRDTVGSLPRGMPKVVICGRRCASNDLEG